jgi:hypothetical protein
MKTKAKRSKSAPPESYEMSSVSFRFRDATLRARFTEYMEDLPVDRVKLCVILAIHTVAIPYLIRLRALYGHHGIAACLYSWLHLAGIALLALVFYGEVYPRRLEAWWAATVHPRYASMCRIRVIVRHAHVFYYPLVVMLGTYVRIRRTCDAGTSWLESQYCRVTPDPLLSVTCVMSLFILVHETTWPVEWGWHVLMWCLGWGPITLTHVVLVRVAPEILTNMYAVVAVYATTLVLQYLVYNHCIREFIGLSKATDVDTETFRMNTDTTLPAVAPHEREREAATYEEMTSSGVSSNDVNVAVRRLKYIVREKPLYAEGEE